MRTDPEDLDERELVGALSDGWGLDVAAVEFVPVGGGTHHWLAVDGTGRRHWVNVDDLDHKDFLGQTRQSVLDNLRRALDTARALAEAGLEFVVAPVPSATREAVLPLGARYAVAVYPFLDGNSFDFNARLEPDDRDELVDLLVRLHAATPAVASAARLLPPEFSERGALEQALHELDRPWTGGPFGEPARALVAKHADGIRGLVETFDRLADQVMAGGGGPVLTHGEPHPANVLRAGGRLYLIDWDTVGLAPPERDLWLVDGGLARYSEASGRQVDEAGIRLYRLRWLLDDIASDVSLFRSAHRETADTELAWRWFVGVFESRFTR